MSERKRRIEFGDFQTPDELALTVCRRLATLGMHPDVVIEPTCGVGAFLLAAAEVFPDAREILGFETNSSYLEILRTKLARTRNHDRIHLEHADFFSTDWRSKLSAIHGSVLVVGNFPWVTNAAQGMIGGSNLPEKSNFLANNVFDAISGKANFDISEWMLLEVLRWFEGRSGDVAMLVKTAVARKVMSHAQRQDAAGCDAFWIGIDAKKEFGGSVDACLRVVRFCSAEQVAWNDYTTFSNLQDKTGRRVGHRLGLTVGDLDAFAASVHLVGSSPQKWRSGVKHDASAIMEFARSPRGLENGKGEMVALEPDYLYPLLKGSDVGSAKAWREKYVLVTQRRVGDATEPIRTVAPLTWNYLESHGPQLDARGSTIYAKNPRFSVFGIGDYAFCPWKIAICGLYKTLRFRLVGPIDGRPVMFDDTVYYLSFDTEEEAAGTLAMIESEPARGLLSSLIFWDEKRPVKTSILNVLDWSKLDQVACRQPALF